MTVTLAQSPKTVAHPAAPRFSPPDVPLAVRGMTVVYGDRTAIADVDYTAPAAKMIAIVGPNGAGKSTFLKAALGIVPRISGEVSFFGLPLSRARHRLAYVPQRQGIDWEFPARVVDVVMMGLYRDIGLFRLARQRHRDLALAALAEVGLVDFARRQIGQLSGGQQQRVFLARALAQKADLLLLDEPFAGVDAATESVLVAILKNLVAAGKTVVCVHHDLTTVPTIFDEVLLLNGRKIASGPVATTFTAERLQETYGGRLAALPVA